MNIIKNIFNDFEKDKINYCHFKSNQHLKESFEGESDFDILVDKNKKNECIKLLIDNGCKQFEPVKIGAYPGVENWLAYDSGTGLIYHIHLHFQLITGKRLVKDYVLPWQDLALSSSFKDNDFNIFIADPNFEIILLLTRLILKGKSKHFFLALIGLYTVPKDMQIEFEYLKERISTQRVRDIGSVLYNSDVSFLIYKAIIENSTIDSKSYLKLNTIIRKELKNYRRKKSFMSLFISKLYRILDVIKKILNRKFNQPYITKKVTSSGGKIITFIGVDGSGKSTVSEVVVKWLGRKTECKKVYMGTGDGKKNIFASIISLVKKRKSSNNKKTFSSDNVDIHFKKNPINYLKKYLHALLIYSVVKDNRKKITKMHSYRLNGGLSILDRYPQLEQDNINDGVKLTRYSEMLNSKLLSKLAKKERELMSIVDSIYPDIVIRLKITPELSMMRKPEEYNDFDAIKFKTESVNKLKFSKSLVFDIDASKDFNEELLEIKNIIWENL